MALLAAIADEGSITAAAKALGMSYRRAWLLVDALNGTFTVPLVHTSHGGRCRGGATLTETGERVLALCRGIERKATQATATDRRVIAKLLLPTHGKKA